MGDRGNIVLEGFHGSDGGRIYLYTHWGGEALPYTLASALGSDRGRNRWDDDLYLARIIADEVFEPYRGQETGGGLGLSVSDNEWPLMIVNLSHKTVYLEEVGQTWSKPYGFEGAADPKSFNEFIRLVGLSTDAWETLITAYGGTDPYAKEDALALGVEEDSS